MWWASLQVTTPEGVSGSGSVELGGPTTPPVITPPVLEPVVLGTYWSLPVEATGSPAPRFSLASGELPPGLALDAVTGLLAGTPTSAGTCTFAIAATNGAGTVTTGPLELVVQAPPSFTIAAPPADLTAGEPVSYTSTADGSPASGFTVTGTLPAGLTLSTAGELSGTPTSVGTSTFGVTATNAAGTATAGPFTVTVAPTAPAAPLGVVAVAGDGHAVVGWEPPIGTGGSDLTSYVVTAAPGGRSCAAEAGVPTCTVDGLTNGEAHTFTVTATNAGDRTSAASEPSAAMVPVGAPGAPAGVNAVPGDREVRVSWTAPDAGGGAAVTGYTAAAVPAGQAAPAATCDTTTSGCTLIGLTNGVAYAVTVTARNAAGQASPATPAAEQIVPFGAPTAPSELTVDPGNKEATVSFRPSSGNGSPVTNYTATAGSGLSCKTGGGTSCVITGLQNGMNYTISVTARNAAGLVSPAAATTVKVVPGKPRK